MKCFLLACAMLWAGLAAAAAPCDGQTAEAVAKAYKRFYATLQKGTQAEMVDAFTQARRAEIAADADKEDPQWRAKPAISVTNLFANPAHAQSVRCETSGELVRRIETHRTSFSEPERHEVQLFKREGGVWKIERLGHSGGISPHRDLKSLLADPKLQLP